MNEPPIAAKILPVTPYQQNCSLVWCTATKKAALIDPGGDVDRLKAALAEAGVALEKILLTHGHLDHASGAARLAREFAVPVEGPHTDDLFLLEDLLSCFFSDHPVKIPNQHGVWMRSIRRAEKIMG